MSLQKRNVRVAVVGGGLSGLTAAWRLGGRGFDVTVFERRKTLGGRAGSFHDPIENGWVDRGQHVVLGACERFLNLMKEWGHADPIAWRDRYTLWSADGGGKLATIGRSEWLPEKLQFLPSFAGYSFLTFGERIQAIRVFSKIAKLTKRELTDADRITFLEWLKSAGASDRCIRRVFEPVVIGALNEEPAAASAQAALWILRTGFLSKSNNSRFGVPKKPLVELYNNGVAEQFTKRNVQIRTGADVERIEMNSDGKNAVIVGGEKFIFDGVVAAANFDAICKLFDPAAMEPIPELNALQKTAGSPILSGHFFFGPDVTVPSGELAILERSAHWIFDRFAASGDGADKGHFITVTSAARKLAAMPRERAEELLLSDIEAAVPSARGKKPRRVLLVTEWNATFSARPGFETARPGTRPGAAGLFLASDACATGWPSTMEGAVRAGEAVAATVEGEIGSKM